MGYFRLGMGPNLGPKFGHLRWAENPLIEILHVARLASLLKSNQRVNNKGTDQTAH